MLLAAAFSSHHVCAYRAACGSVALRPSRSPQRGAAGAVQMSLDAPLVIGAALLAATTGTLLSSVASGDKGIGAFLSKEKWENPFYQPGFRSDDAAPRPVRTAQG